MEDKELYQEFLNGNNEALNKILERYKNNLIYFISRYTKNIEASEDIFQDVVLYILEKKEIYDFKYSFKTYLYTIAKSRAINYIKKEKKYTNIETIVDSYADTKLLEEIIFSNERQKKIKEVIGNLKTDYQIVLYLTRNRRIVL
ncbi:MAG: RNA polymerase sigma factor [Clostridia bacterium]